MVLLDSNVYIYFLEGNPEFAAKSEHALAHALAAGPVPVASMTLMEIMSGGAGQSVIDFFDDTQFTVHNLTSKIAVLGGQLRATYPALRTGDAVHLATALAAGASQFITNDERLAKLIAPPGLEIIPLQRF